MTTSHAEIPVSPAPGVYAPQQDSMLLIDAMRNFVDVPGRSVLDLCTGSGIAAVAAAGLGARAVTAFDICPRAVSCARRNAAAAGVAVDVRVGGCGAALSSGPYDVVVANPPYVPAGPDAHRENVPTEMGPARAWNAGPDGRMVLDPLCRNAGALLGDHGVMLIVQSEFAGPDMSLWMLRRQGLRAQVVEMRTIPFGPVLTARAGWLERAGLLQPGRRLEQLCVIKAEKP